MKLRIKGDSLRLRLQQQEINALSKEGEVVETMQIGPSLTERFTYRVAVHPGDAPAVTFEANELSLLVPREWAQTLADTQQVGFHYEMPTGQGAHLRILLEKDFQCLVEREGEDETDSFPNPKNACGAGDGGQQ